MSGFQIFLLLWVLGWVTTVVLNFRLARVAIHKLSKEERLEPWQDAVAFVAGSVVVLLIWPMALLGMMIFPEHRHDQPGGEP